MYGALQISCFGKVPNMNIFSQVFANAHMYHINSIAINSDDETYLSADDLRINLWNLEITDRSFS